MNLIQKKCVPCEGIGKKLEASEIQSHLSQIEAWQVQGEKLFKNFQFKNFVFAMSFVNRMAELAEEEGHHPDFAVHYNQVEVWIWTHALGGLTENDFILAAKIDEL